MKKISLFLALSFISLSDTIFAESLNPDLYNVWTIEELAMREMIYNSMNYYVDENPEDSLPQIYPNDRIIIIESKKDPRQIYEFRYGSNDKYHIINGDQIKWILPKKLRSMIVEKNYFYINDDSYIRISQNSLEKEYLTNQIFWTNRDILVSLGSKFIFDRFIYRITSIAGLPILPVYAVSVRVDNELLGYPRGSKGMMDLGLMGRYYEIGVQTAVFEFISDKYSHIILPDTDNGKYLQGGIGGYGKVSLSNSQVHLAFADVINNEFVRGYIKDSTYVDYLSLSVFGISDIFHKPIAKLGHLKAMLGLGFYEISHKSLTSEEVFIDRTTSRDGLIYDSASSRFGGAMIRFDFITLIKKESYNFPLLQIFAQVNAYEGNASWIVGSGLNYKKVGLDLSYKHSIDDVDWAPKDEVFLSFNYVVR